MTFTHIIQYLVSSHRHFPNLQTGTMDFVAPSSGFEFLDKERSAILAILTISLIVSWIFLGPSQHPKVDVPTIKLVSPLLPESLSRLLFNSSASTAIYAGYREVSSNAPFFISLGKR